ncbi:MAG: LPS assembly lipoprotein LptE [Chromatiales bacterium]|jgi:LPS-assembly lipoprotein
MMHQRLLRATLPLWGLLATLAVTACGWQLRGATQLPAEISPVYVQGRTPFAAIDRHLARALESAGVRLADSRAGAGSVLRILGEDTGRRLLTVDGRGKGLEYELYQILEFDLTDAAGTELVPPQRLVARQALLNPEIQTLGKQQEQEDLREAMREDLATRVINRLEARLR